MPSTKPKENTKSTKAQKMTQYSKQIIQTYNNNSKSIRSYSTKSKQIDQ